MANEKRHEMSRLSSQICNQISSVFSNPTDPHPPPLDLLVTELAGVSRRGARVFLHGVGREGLMLKAFAMRLFHLGLSSHLVSDMTTPPISSPDLLIASAGRRILHRRRDLFRREIVRC
ncbi:hypothetical protein Bca52824_043637 [Brassica carinata]|uniref:SIS domain-containing protein n=1 Tax=Brassica carinata TaxID=52824 RepID=A0A8X7RZE3_BRACI|nr:hypothetical protein Bca52824_043637 [Brassica carinata]